MSKPYIEYNRNKTLPNNESDKLLTGAKQVIQEPDLFYEIEPAEVLQSITTIADLEKFQILDSTGAPDKSYLNCCLVRRLYTEEGMSILEERGDEIYKHTARPLDSNILKIPIAGEVVPIINFLSSDSTKNTKRKISYYMSNVNVWNSPHHNSLPNISIEDDPEGTSNETIKSPEDGNPFLSTEEIADLGDFFTERGDIKRTQVYQGDVLVEGRFGQHIRLGSSDKRLEENPNWWSEGSEETLGKPVTIISNGQSVENTSALEPRDLYSSDINKDSSTIILTENQPSSLDVSYLDLDNDDAILNTLNFDLVDDTSNPSIQMNTDTILLNARNNKLFGFAKQGIGLVTTGDMSIDVTNKWETVSNEKEEEMITSYKMVTPDAKFEAKKSKLGQGQSEQQPMVMGDVLVEVLNELIDAIPKYIFVGGAGPNLSQSKSPGEVLHTVLKQKINTILLSKNHTLD